MSFAPVIPFGGYAGWTFLKRTMATQQAALAAAPEQQRDTAYFRENIGAVSTAEQLVSDRRLLKVALGAFGLEADLNNRFFIRKVLEDGTLKDGALALRLADPRYRELSAAFGFGDFTTPNTKLSDFAEKTLAAYAQRGFEAAVGQQNDTMRLALNAEREVAVLAGRTSSEDTKWFTVMGSKPLRQVFQTVLGLPASFASIDLDQQLTVLKEKTERVFGSPTVSQFADPGAMDKLLRTFLTRSDAATGSASAQNSLALQLLQAGSFRPARFR
jgi:hypothetical protein